LTAKYTVKHENHFLNYTRCAVATKEKAGAVQCIKCQLCHKYWKF
jgi:hypothetical protein